MVRKWRWCKDVAGKKGVENNHFKPLWFSSFTYLRFFERAQLELIPRISSKYSNFGPFWPFTYCRGHLKMAPLASALSSLEAFRHKQRNARKSVTRNMNSFASIMSIKNNRILETSFTAILNHWKVALWESTQRDDIYSFLRHLGPFAWITRAIV